MSRSALIGQGRYQLIGGNTTQELLSEVRAQTAGTEARQPSLRLPPDVQCAESSPCPREQQLLDS